LVREIKKEI